ncbi:hypothetical protein [Thalassotalea piscium]|uniref:Uncharacterized protein n=1 Tax=Thalassotalea piscium TaxID=1230533 RepID=A0A7X0NGT3_9GAMM|nr:hypothetical protein [Thalassotalea piscium]MBB6543098.1 hypothetical protein [Thalassotalea piscium]
MQTTHFNHANPLTVFILNVRYAFKYYFLSHVLFCAPYIAVVMLLDVSDGIEQALGYASLVTWFSYGLYVTRQKVFVAVIGILFMVSQWAAYQDLAQLDMTLTLICVLIMAVKQYQGCAYFALLYDIENQVKNKENS